MLTLNIFLPFLVSLLFNLKRQILPDSYSVEGHLQIAFENLNKFREMIGVFVG